MKQLTTERIKYRFGITRFSNPNDTYLELRLFGSSWFKLRWNEEGGCLTVFGKGAHWRLKSINLYPDLNSLVVGKWRFFPIWRVQKI